MQLQDVATWLGVITGIVGVTLSIVAIWFAVMVDQRSRQVTDQTIKSLQKIETSVERQSSDTQNLIKAGWDRMLGNTMGDGKQVAFGDNTEGLKQVATGIAAELRAELFLTREDTSEGAETPVTRDVGSEVAVFDDAMRQLARAFENQAAARFPRSGSSDPIDYWIHILGILDPTSYELAKALARYGAHLERPQYLKLSRHPVTRNAVRELRIVGLLAPLSNSEGAPVYWFPPGVSNTIRAALSLLEREDADASAEVRRAMVDARYLTLDGDAYTIDRDQRHGGGSD